MGFRQKLDAKRLLSGAVMLGAVVLAWAIERPKKPAPPAMETYPAGWTVDPQAHPPSAGILRMRWRWWRAVLLETYEAMGKDRLLAVAAGVVFYALLAIFPAITAFVSSYGLFANTARSRTTCRSWPTCCRPAAYRSSRSRSNASRSKPSGLSVGFVVGLAIALWSANAGVKAMIDALNVIEGQDERRSFVRLNAAVAHADARRHRVPAARGRRGGRLSAGDVRPSG